MFSSRRLFLAAILTASIILAPACSNLPTEPHLQEEAQTAPAASESPAESFRAYQPDEQVQDLQGLDGIDIDGRLGVTRVY